MARTFEKNYRFEKKLKDKSEFEKKKQYLVAQFCVKKSNFLGNLGFEKISALMVPKNSDQSKSFHQRTRNKKKNNFSLFNYDCMFVYSCLFNISVYVHVKVYNYH